MLLSEGRGHARLAVVSSRASGPPPESPSPPTDRRPWRPRPRCHPDVVTGCRRPQDRRLRSPFYWDRWQQSDRTQSQPLTKALEDKTATDSVRRRLCPRPARRPGRPATGSLSGAQDADTDVAGTPRWPSARIIAGVRQRSARTRPRRRRCPSARAHIPRREAPRP